MNIHKVIGENIRGYRKRNQLTQEALAGRVSFHSNYISRVERGEEKVSIDGLMKIAKALKVEPNLLLIKDSFLL